MRSRIRAWLHALLGWSDPDAGAPGASRAAPRAATEERYPGPMPLKEFERNLRHLLYHNDEAMLGKVSVLGLGRVREHLGARWNELAEAIHHTTHKAIEARLGGRDYYTKVGNQDYVIVFADADEAEAHERCQRIAEDIGRWLFDDSSVAGLVSVKAVAAKGGRELFAQRKPSADAVKEFLAERTRASDKVEVRPPEAASAPEPELHGIDFRFRPAWHVRQNVLASYHCVARREEDDDGEPRLGYRVLPDEPEHGMIARLDHAALERVIGEMGRLQRADETVLLGLPVHFETLASNIHYQRYIQACQAIPEDWRHLLVFDIVGLPTGVPKRRLMQLSLPLKPFSRVRMLRLAPEHRDVPDLLETGLHAVGRDVADYPDLPLAKLAAELARVVSQARNHGLRTYLKGAHSREMLALARRAGYDYVDGDAIGAPVENAGPVSAFSAETATRPRA